MHKRNLGIYRHDNHYSLDKNCSYYIIRHVYKTKGFASHKSFVALIDKFSSLVDVKRVNFQCSLHVV